MSQGQSFEDLIAWQKAREPTRLINKVSAQGDFGRDFGLRDQMRRAAVSIMSNIAEGFDRNSPADFARFLNIAKGSCAELRAQLYVALDVNYIDEGQFSTLVEHSKEVSRIIAGLVRSIKHK